MKVNAFYPGYNPNNAAIVKAFARACGADVFQDKKYVPCDVMVIFGLVKKSFPPSFAKERLLRQHKGPVIVLERGFVKRKDYFSVGIGGINGEADFLNRNAPSDRWYELAVDLKPWKVGRTRNVLVCGQVPWDVTVQNHAHIDWCQRTVREVLASGVQCRFRAHPYAMARGVDYGVVCESSKNELAEDLAWADVCVTFSSNSGVDAVIEGVPTIAVNAMSMVYGLVSESVSQLHTPLRPCREQWAASLAYAQWRPDEFSKAWDHVRRGIE